MVDQFGLEADLEVDLEADLDWIHVDGEWWQVVAEGRWAGNAY
jgi:hypothetical protein